VGIGEIRQRKVGPGILAVYRRLGTAGGDVVRYKSLVLREAEAEMIREMIREWRWEGGGGEAFSCALFMCCLGGNRAICMKEKNMRKEREGDRQRRKTERGRVHRLFVDGLAMFHSHSGATLGCSRSP